MKQKVCILAKFDPLYFQMQFILPGRHTVAVVNVKQPRMGKYTLAIITL